MSSSPDQCLFRFAWRALARKPIRSIARSPSAEAKFDEAWSRPFDEGWEHWQPHPARPLPSMPDFWHRLW